VGIQILKHPLVLEARKKRRMLFKLVDIEEKQFVFRDEDVGVFGEDVVERGRAAFWRAADDEIGEPTGRCNLRHDGRAPAPNISVRCRRRFVSVRAQPE